MSQCLCSDHMWAHMLDHMFIIYLVWLQPVELQGLAMGGAGCIHWNIFIYYGCTQGICLNFTTTARIPVVADSSVARAAQMSLCREVMSIMTDARIQGSSR